MITRRLPVEFVNAAAKYECVCFGTFGDGTNACFEHTHWIWLSQCTVFTVDYDSDVKCSDVSTDTQIADGAYYAAWYGNYAWWNSPVYAKECFPR